MAYGAAPFSLSATASSGLPVSFSVISGPATVTNSTLTITGTGTVTVEAAQMGDDTWNPAPPVDQAFAVGPAPLVVTAQDAARTYGKSNPNFSATFSGFVNDEDTNALHGTLTLETTAGTNSPVGTYPIIPSGLSSTNYSIVWSNGTLTVTARELVAEAEDASRAYGATNPVLAGLLGGAMPEDGITASYSTTAVTNSPIGDYPITVSLSDPNNRLSNYSVFVSDAVLTVTQAVLTVTANSLSRTYGETNPVLADTITGFVNGETQAAVVTGNPALSTTATQSSGVGSYPITPTIGSLAASNYSFSFIQGNLLVTSATLTGLAGNQIRLYGQTNLPFTVTYSGFVNGDNAGIVTGTLVGTTPAQTNSPVGAYPINISGQSAPNYTINYQPGILTINPSPLLITASNASRAYGQTNPVFSAIFSGFVNNESPTVLQGTLALTTTATTNSHVGLYPIQPSGLSATNYSITFSNGTLTVSAYALLVQASNQSRLYGQTNPALSGTLVGVQNGDNITASFSTSAQTNSPVGTYNIVPSLSDPGQKLTNYSVTSSNGILTINPAPLLITASNATRAYGQTNPVFSAGFNGFVNNESPSVLQGTLALTTTATTNSHIGLYPIQPSGLSATNYSITFSNGTLTVTTYALLVQASNQTRLYGQTNPPLSGTLVGVQNGDNITASFSTSAQTNSPVGAYNIVPSLSDPGQKLTNYSVTSSNGILTINPTPLLITASNATRAYGQTNPVFSAGFNGFVNNESPSVLQGTLALTTTATTNSHVGLYPIQPSGLSATNYSITFSNGTLTVNRATLTVTANNQQRVFSAPNPQLTVTFSGFVNGETAAVVSGSAGLTTTATNASPPGSYPITATIGSLSANNYTFSFVGGTLTIGLAASTNVLTSSANPATQGSNITFTVTVAPAAPAVATPAGTVQFFTNGISMGSPVALTNGIAQTSSAFLPPGSNTVTVAYPGNGDFFGSTNSLIQSVLSTSQTPIAQSIQISTNGTMTVTFKGVPGTQYVVQATSSLNSPIQWLNVSTNTAGSANGLWTYTESMAGHSQRFFRCVQLGQTPSAVGIKNNLNGTVTVTFSGAAGARYAVMATTNLAPPVVWTAISTNTAGSGGLWTITTPTTNYPRRFFSPAGL
jgi:hypothetical protein